MRMPRPRSVRYLLPAAAALLLGGAALTLKPLGGAPAEAQARPAAAAAEPERLNPWSRPAEPTRSAFHYDRFETLDMRDGLPSNKVTAVLAEDGRLAVGTDRGLAVGSREAGFAVWGEAQGLSHRYVTSIARHEPTGDLWVSTLRGLNRLSGGSLRVYTQINSGLMNDVVYHVVVDGDRVWAATAAGTSCLDLRTGSWALYDHENTIMHEPWSYAVAVGPQRTWVGVWGGGVVELDRLTGQWREYRDPDGEMELDLMRDDGPLHDVTAFVAYAEGVLWQATYFGLSRYDGRRWRTYTARDSGLPGDFVSHVWARGQTVWIGTDQGLAVFDGETLVAYKRQADGSGLVSEWRDGREVERRELPTALADNSILWVQGGASEAWIATGRGLTHALAGGSGDLAKAGTKGGG